MVAGKWTDLYDGGIYYGAPAHGGGLKVTPCETKEDGATVHFVTLEIQRIDGTEAITIPTSKLKPIIEYLNSLTCGVEQKDYC